MDIKRPAIKMPFVEALRGIGACQVLLLHYCAAFLPLFARVGGPQHFGLESRLGRSPLFLGIDGYSAVYVFFIMSGFVLAPTVARAGQGLPGAMLKRFIRLFLPLLASSCVALLLYAAMPDARSAAAHVSGSGWLAALQHNPMTALALARDALLSSLVLGYQGQSVFQLSGWDGAALAPIAQALNAPTWTLHIEFWGSLLILALSYLSGRVPRYVFAALLLCLAFVLGTNQLGLFLFGFVAYTFHDVLLRQTGALASWLGAGLMLAGCYLCVAKDAAPASALLAWLGPLTVWKAESDFHWQSQLGAMLLFAGVMLNAPVRAVLARRFFLWLGRLSFSVYLLHFPILFTLGCLVFSMMAPASYGMAFVVTLVLGAALTFWLALPFERFVDRSAVNWSRRAADVFYRRWASRPA